MFLSPLHFITSSCLIKCFSSSLILQKFIATIYYYRIHMLNILEDYILKNRKKRYRLSNYTNIMNLYFPAAKSVVQAKSNILKFTTKDFMFYLSLF